MKKNLFSRVSLIFILISLLLLTNYVKPIIAKDFDIVMTNLNEDEITQITEEEYFMVFILGDSQEIIEYVYKVDIIFNNEPYFIDETGFIELKAPEVTEDTYCTIEAFKTGYNDTNTTILIKNIKKLDITTDDVVDAGHKFSVKVSDYDKPLIPISGALVFIQSDDVETEESYTNEKGIAYLTAPRNRESITVIATKDGYIQYSKRIEINIEPAWWEKLIKNDYFPIIIALIILIIIIILVHFRQQKSIYKKAKEITDKKTMEKYENIDLKRPKNNEKEEDVYYKRDDVRLQEQDDAKVEEIRISRPRKEKEVVPIDLNKDVEDKIIEKKKNQMHEYEWYEGSDDIKYEIDKLTGEIDEEGIDKWFEGIDDLRKKIDEKMKKKEKKKIEDE